MECKSEDLRVFPLSGMGSALFSWREVASSFIFSFTYN